jgi:hypothetical protein
VEGIEFFRLEGEYSEKIIRPHVDHRAYYSFYSYRKKNLADAVTLMNEEYREDKKLTAFSQLDMENFYEAR